MSVRIVPFLSFIAAPRFFGSIEATTILTRGAVYHRLPRRIRAHALICFMALVLYRVMRMRLEAAKRSESPTTLLEQLKRIHQQTAVTAEGKTLTGWTEITALQKSLFAALELAPPNPSDLAKPVL